MAIIRFESDKDAAIKLHFVGQEKSTSFGCGSCASVSNVLLSERRGRDAQSEPQLERITVLCALLSHLPPDVFLSCGDVGVARDT